MTSLLVLWIHVLSAIFWVGGMFFLSFVLAPLLRSQSESPNTYLFFQQAARRFRNAVWVAVTLLLLTGPLLLSNHISFARPFQEWPGVILTKLGLVGALIVFAGLHDLVIGPRVGTLKKKPSTSLTRSEQTLVKMSRILARGVLVLGIAVVLAGTAISRW